MKRQAYIKYLKKMFKSGQGPQIFDINGREFFFEMEIKFLRPKLKKMKHS